MTPLKPISNTTRVRGVPSKRYPPNTVCAHPECSEPVESIHHIFGRPPGPDSDSWFVKIQSEEEFARGSPNTAAEPIPHAIGLCGSGTTGHHGDVEAHRAWIKLEDGEFVWYESTREGYFAGRADEFESLGPLNPQPGSREGKPKRKRFKGEARRTRKVISIKVPNDAQEAGGQVWDELIENVKTRLKREGLDPERPAYYILVDALNDWLNTK